MTRKASDWMFGCFLGLVAIALILGNISAALDAPGCRRTQDASGGER